MRIGIGNIGSLDIEQLRDAPSGGEGREGDDDDKGRRRDNELAAPDAR
jgi:hypothetical protein